LKTIIATLQQWGGGRGATDMKALKRFLREAAGQDMIEYALMAASVAVTVAAFIPYTVIPALSTIYSKLGSVMYTLTGVGS
jgi:Flp pilus assembly pilin Flp